MSTPEEGRFAGSQQSTPLAAKAGEPPASDASPMIGAGQSGPNPAPDASPFDATIKRGDGEASQSVFGRVRAGVSDGVDKVRSVKRTTFLSIVGVLLIAAGIVGGLEAFQVTNLFGAPPLTHEGATADTALTEGSDGFSGTVDIELGGEPVDDDVWTFEELEVARENEVDGKNGVKRYQYRTSTPAPKLAAADGSDTDIHAVAATLSEDAETACEESARLARSQTASRQALSTAAARCTEATEAAKSVDAVVDSLDEYTVVVDGLD